MHIADGVLPLSVTLATYGLSLVGTAWSLRHIRTEDMPKIAVATSAFFVASLIHLPLPPTSVHLLLPGVLGALLGPAAFVAVLLGLILQCLLFQFGGITALGANTLMMGLPAVFCGWLFQWLRGPSNRRTALAGGLAGGLGTLLAGLILAVLLTTAGEHFKSVAQIVLLSHIPVALIEAVVGGATVSFLQKVRPELLSPQIRLLHHAKEDGCVHRC